MTLPATMNAVLLTGHGGLDKLVYSEVPRPEPRDGEVLVKVGACGLNNTDINTRTAWYSSTVKAGVGEGGHEGFEAADGNTGTWGSGSLNFPVIQGADVAGRIVAVGNGVSEARVGERVMIDPWLLGHGDWLSPDNSGYFGSETNGGYAEYTAVRAANAIPVNSDLSDRELATFPCAYTTAGKHGAPHCSASRRNGCDHRGIGGRRDRSNSTVPPARLQGHCRGVTRQGRRTPGTGR